VQTYVALLRAVTPTGKNKVPMAQLRDVLTAAGFGRMRTYIQSGNVLIDTDSPPPVLAQQINILIKRHIGPDLKVIVRTCGELTAILQADPFRDYENAASCTYFVHFDEQPPDAATQAVATQEYGRDEIVFEDRTAYLYIPGTYGDSKLSGPNWTCSRTGSVFGKIFPHTACAFRRRYTFTKTVRRCYIFLM